jgi:Putative Actinobacterial Holin-X, holin superfamily III
MAYQTVRNGPAAANNRQNNGVIEGVSSFGSDLATLATLQARLAAYDLRESMKSAAPAIAGLVTFATIAAASTVIGLAGLALWLATVLRVQAGIVMMVVALAGIVIAGVASALLARLLTSSFSSFRRSREELDRNIAWIKTTIVHSGR